MLQARRRRPHYYLCRENPGQQAYAVTRRSLRFESTFFPRKAVEFGGRGTGNLNVCSTLADGSCVVPQELRQYIDLLNERGALVRVSRRVDWKYEIGTLTRKAKAPLLFETIVDYPEASVFTNGLSSRDCFALCLGLDPRRTNWGDLVRRVRRGRVPIKPTPSKLSAVLRERRGSGVDLYALPTPWWHRADAKRYIGTWHINITRDPVTGIENAGVYRMKVLDEKHTTVSVSPKSHLAQHVKEAERRGEPLAMAVAVGVAEPVVIAAAAALNRGENELAFAGGLMGRPLEVQNGDLCDLPVPSNAEVYMEGELLLNTRVSDGPYMDYAGIPNVNPHAHVYRVGRLAWRKDVIFRGTSVGEPGGEDHLLFALLAAANLADFHGSVVRKIIQNFLLRLRLFRLLQATGVFSQRLRGKVPAKK
ncbi:MAG: hypothetical protein GF344_00030 [Chitinivibrionales bacterium]|nr:hypothetical protein [Chitinivibrionales bacterium]MBD3355517.1 hypothetical protein [Chitinivibrionales bacterium]